MKAPPLSAAESEDATCPTGRSHVSLDRLGDLRMIVRARERSKSEKAHSLPTPANPMSEWELPAPLLWRRGGPRTRDAPPGSSDCRRCTSRDVPDAREAPACAPGLAGVRRLLAPVAGFQRPLSIRLHHTHDFPSLAFLSACNSAQCCSNPARVGLTPRVTSGCEWASI